MPTAAVLNAATVKNHELYPDGNAGCLVQILPDKAPRYCLCTLLARRDSLRQESERQYGT